MEQYVKMGCVSYDDDKFEKDIHLLFLWFHHWYHNLQQNEQTKTL